jgi:RNA polymerase sigma-70 factor, ECF subfamily
VSIAVEMPAGLPNDSRGPRLPSGSAHAGSRTAFATSLDPESQAWLTQLRGRGVVRDAAIARLHRLLVTEARHEVRRRTAALAHPSGRDLDDLALMAADDALMAILSKLGEFRGDARFTTWARRFADLEVPGKIRRRLGHARETPTDSDTKAIASAQYANPVRQVEARELARTLGDLIAHELTDRQREVLIGLAIHDIDTDVLAQRLDSTPGALYKALHDARRKLKGELDRLDATPSSADHQPVLAITPAFNSPALQ